MIPDLIEKELQRLAYEYSRDAHYSQSRDDFNRYIDTLHSVIIKMVEEINRQSRINDFLYAQISSLKEEQESKNIEPILDLDI